MSKKENERRMVFARERAAKAWKGTMHPQLLEAFTEILVVYMYEPHLGCASTRELIDEVTARIDDLDYKPVGDN